MKTKAIETVDQIMRRWTYFCQTSHRWDTGLCSECACGAIREAYEKGNSNKRADSKVKMSKERICGRRELRP